MVANRFIGGWAGNATLHDLGLVHPRWALSLEENLARRRRPPLEPLVLLWRSSVPCFVHGRGRSPLAELGSLPPGACVVERFTGGGTVYLDEGVLSVAVIVATRGEARKDIGVLYDVVLESIVRALSRRACCFERRNSNDVVYRGRKVMGTAGAIRRRVYHLHFTVLLYSRIGWALRWYRPLEELLRLHPRPIDPVKHMPANLHDLDPARPWGRIVVESVLEAAGRLGEF